MELNPISGEITLAQAHRAARFACYKQYIYMVSGWIPGQGHVHLPTCMEINIKRQFQGDGIFVGFRARAGNPNDDN